MNFPADLPPPDSYDAVLFDFDGTIVKTAPNHNKAWLHALHQQGVKAEGDIISGYGGVSSTAVALSLAQIHKVNAKQLHDAAHAVKVTLMEGWEPINDVVDFAERCPKKAIVTGGDPEGTLHVMFMLPKVWSVFAKTMIFHPHSMGALRGKPAPDMFLLAASHLNTDPSRCIVIEDATIGLEAASRAGMRGYKVSP